MSSTLFDPELVVQGVRKWEISRTAGGADDLGRDHGKERG